MIMKFYDGEPGDKVIVSGLRVYKVVPNPAP